LDSRFRLHDIHFFNLVVLFCCLWLLLGTVHCITTSPDGNVIGIGYTSGVLSTLDLRTGMLLASWKAHEADILDVMSLLHLSCRPNWIVV